MFNVGDKVVFIGPEYQFGAGGPSTGERGVVVEANGHTSQRVGQEPEVMVTVTFPNHPKDIVVSANRLNLVN